MLAPVSLKCPCNSAQLFTPTQRPQLTCTKQCAKLSLHKLSRRLASVEDRAATEAMARLALALLAAVAPRRCDRRRASRARRGNNLFGGAPPEEDTPASPPPGQGGQTMSVPGLGDITEEEMKLAMEFRQKMAQKMQETRVEGSALGGKVKVVYDGQGQPSSVEVTDAALGEGADKVAQGVVDAAKQAQGEALVKMKAIMQDMQKDIALGAQADKARQGVVVAAAKPLASQGGELVKMKYHHAGSTSSDIRRNTSPA